MSNALQDLRQTVAAEHIARGWANTQANYKKLVKEVMSHVGHPEAFVEGSNMRKLYHIILGGGQ